MKKAKKKTALSPKKIIRRKRQIQAAKNLASGMPKEASLIAAGYSPNYVKSHGYQIIRKPYIQSLFTEAVERVMQARNKEFDDLVKPYVEALDAPVVVKSTTEGVACIAKDPDTQEVIPDHEVRMKAAERLIDLYGGTEKQKTEVNIEFTLEQLVLGAMKPDVNNGQS